MKQVSHFDSTGNTLDTTNPFATYGANPLTWRELHDLRIEVPELLTRYAIASAGLKTTRKASAQNARCMYTMIKANVRLIEIGDRLARELVAGVETLEELLSKWEGHHYRPTLRMEDRAAQLLADVYDHIADCHGINVKAYRG